MKKRILALILALATIISVFAISAVPAYAAVSQETYPIKAYPHGKYYTTDGTACSSSHTKCKTYDNSSQCMAFAKYVSDQYAHRDSFAFVPGDTIDTTNVTDKSKNRSFSDWDTAKKELKKLDYGTYVRVHKKGVSDKSKGHSFILLAVYEDSVYVYDANFDGDCKVQVHKISSNIFISRYDQIQKTMSHDFSKYSKYDTSYHKVACSSSGCKGYIYQAHTLEYTHTSSSHTSTCSKCGYSATQSHNLSYKKKDTTTHTATCNTCGYSFVGNHFANTTGSNKICLACGAKGIIAIEGRLSIDDEIDSIDNDISS